LAVAFLLSPSLAAAGSISGRVSVLEKGGGPAEEAGPTLVYVEGATGPITPTEVTIKMERKVFSPRVVVVQVGSTVHFPNLDSIHHNAFSVSGKNRFDLDLYKKPESRSVTFRRAGIVRVYCNIHPQMSAIVIVRDGPHYSWAERDGRFVLRGLAPGRYTVKAWNERASEVERAVLVPEEGEVEVELTLDASRYKPAQHKNKFGQDYRLDGKY
jgi:plastocyanin